MKTMFPRLPGLFIASAVALLFAAPVLAADEKLSAAVQRQIETLQAEKAGRTPAQDKMDSQLIFKAKKLRGESLGAGLAAMEQRITIDKDEKELVDIQADVTDALLQELTRVGSEIVASVPRFRSVRARVPVKAIEGLAARADVQFIRPAVKAITHAGAKTSQGDATHRSDKARTDLRATGRGIKVGIISDSVDSLTASQASNDLGPVTVLPGQSGLGQGNSGEGTAMLEIVHDLAPDAELFFASAFLSEAQFAQNILDLRAAGCDIIADDVGYFDESPFQDGPVAQAVDQVVASGALYFSAAGNEGSVTKATSGTWEGDFVDGGAATGVDKAGRLHSFGANAYNNVTLSSGIVTLFWSDPAGASRNDYDVYLFDSTGTTLLTASTNTQNGKQDPYEIMQTGSSTRVVVVKSGSAKPRHLHLNSLRGTLETSTTGTIQGHPAAAGAIAVAAVDATVSFPNPFTTANKVENFTTDGDRRFFFYADGTPTTAGNFLASGGLVRSKPDLAAADGVATSVPGFDSFYGTSAAAPHAAAIAAQVWSRNRTLTPAQVRTALTSTALDIEGTGFDNVSGVGLLDAFAAVQSVTGAPIVQPGTVSITAESFTPANNVVDPGETITVSLPLQNIGAGSTGNLVARLLPTGGVTNPSTPAAYGVLAAGATASRSYSFQANGGIGGAVNLTFELTDGATYLGLATARFPIGAIGAAQTFNNTAAITIPLSGAATPYPSSIAVTGVTGTVAKVTVTLNGLSHTYPADVGALLVSPTGKKVLLIGGIGGSTDATTANLTFDDSAPTGVASPIVTGTYRPTVGDPAYLTFSITAPAPAAPYANVLSNFNGDAANGSWSLYVFDYADGDGGSIATGWTLKISPALPPSTNGPNADLVPSLQQSKTEVAVGEYTTYTATVYNNGPATANSVVLTDVLPAALAFDGATASAGTVSNAGNTVTANLGSLGSGQSATVTISARGATAGAITNTVSVALTGTENSTTNNSASLTATVGQANLTAAQPAGWSAAVVVSKVTGTVTDATSIAATDPLFFDLALKNTGTVTANAYFNTELYVDNVLRRTFTRQLPLAAGATERQLDLPLGTFAAGTHTVRVRIDALDDLAESSESDNVFTRTFTVDGSPGGGTNGAPSFTKGSDIVAGQDAGTQSIPHWATNISAGPPEDAGQTLSFAVLNDKPGLFLVPPAISSAGTLTFSPSPAASGTATVTVTLNDDGGTANGGVNASTPQSFLISVTTFREEVGTYNGLVRSADATVAKERNGLFTLTLMKTGRFTGKLTLFGGTVSISGAFDNGGIARFGSTVAPTLVVKRKNQPDLLLTLTLDVTGSTHQLNGTLTKQGLPFSAIAAEQALFTNKASPAPPFVPVPSGLLGSYTVVFAAKTPAEQGLTADKFPQGDGVGTLTVANTGLVTLRGTLADGTAISSTSTLSVSQVAPFYVALSKGLGSISGPITFRPRNNLSEIDGPDLQWFKPPGTVAPYKVGWPTGIKTDFLGSKYGTTDLAAFGAADADGNAQATFLDGGLTGSGLLKALNFNINLTPAVIKPGADKLALTLTKATGALSGSVVLSSNVKAKVYGSVFRAQSTVFGFFLSPAGSGSLTIAPVDHPVTP